MFPSSSWLLQTIVDHYDSRECSVSERLKLFYCSGASPRWIVQVSNTAAFKSSVFDDPDTMLTRPTPPPPKPPLQKQLAAIMISLGCVSSALLVYEKLELWEDAVVCLERLGQHGKVSHCRCTHTHSGL